MSSYNPTDKKSLYIRAFNIEGSSNKSHSVKKRFITINLPSYNSTNPNIVNEYPNSWVTNISTSGNNGSSSTPANCTLDLTLSDMSTSHFCQIDPHVVGAVNSIGIPFVQITSHSSTNISLHITDISKVSATRSGALNIVIQVTCYENIS